MGFYISNIETAILTLFNLDMEDRNLYVTLNSGFKMPLMGYGILGLELGIGCQMVFGSLNFLVEGWGLVEGVY